MHKNYVKKTIGLLAVCTLFSQTAFAESSNINHEEQTLDLSPSITEESESSPVNTLSENPVSELFSDEDSAVVSAGEEPQKLIYSSYTFGSDLSDDIKEGKMLFCHVPSGNTTPLSPADPNTETGAAAIAKGAYYISSENADRASNYTVLNGVNCVFSTKFYRPNASTSPGYFYFSLGDDVTTEDKSFTVEVEYYGNTELDLHLSYIIDDEKHTNTLTAKRVNSNAWETASFTFSDAYFNGKNSTGLADGKCDFRIGVNSVDTYIRRVTIYNSPNYETLFHAQEQLTLQPEEPICENFALPQAPDCMIEWTCSHNNLITIDGNTAVIHPDYSERTVTLTARIIKDGYYLEKSFPVTLAKRARREVEIGEPVVTTKNGRSTVEVAIGNAGSLEEKIYLLVTASDKTTGEITAAASDVCIPGASDNVVLKSEIPVEAGQELSYYVINQAGASMINSAPANPSAFSAVRSGMNAIELSWDAAADDYSFIESYTLTMDGRELAVIPYSAADDAGHFRYTVNQLPSEAYCRFSVTAQDHMGLCSDPQETYMTITAPGRVHLADIDGDRVSFYLNENIDGGDGYSESAVANGVSCRKTVNRKPINGKSQTFLYFRCDRELVATGDRNVLLEITYLDKGTGALSMTYNSLNGENRNMLILEKMTDTNTWKTVTVTLSDAMFNRLSSLTNCDFRIGGTDEIYISDIAVLSLAQ